MKTKDFKLLIEGFNDFLLNEHIGHTSQCTKLFDAIPVEFEHYINDNMHWYNGDSWLSETDHGNDLDAEADEKLLFEEVAKACGCQVNELLVNFVDGFVDEVHDTAVQPTNPDDFLGSYRSSGSHSGSGVMCGSFEINGVSLKGFYYQLGSSCGLEFQFKSSMSERTLKGLIFVAPNCSGGSVSSSDKSEPKNFKGVLGGVWG